MLTIAPNMCSHIAMQQQQQRQSAQCAHLQLHCCLCVPAVIWLACALPHLQHADTPALATTSHMGAAARAAGKTWSTSLSSGSCCRRVCAGGQRSVPCVQLISWLAEPHDAGGADQPCTCWCAQGRSRHATGFM